MDLDDLDRVARAYDVHPATLLFAPVGAIDTVHRMQDAGSLVERMPNDAAEEWLAMGRRIANAPHA